jgi:hypothetical protein
MRYVLENGEDKDGTAQRRKKYLYDYGVNYDGYTLRDGDLPVPENEKVFMDCFSSLGLRPPVTHPNVPTGSYLEDICPEQVLDWILFDRSVIRPVAASVIEYKTGIASAGCALSDHKPVQFVFKI